MCFLEDKVRKLFVQLNGLSITLMVKSETVLKQSLTNVNHQKKFLKLITFCLSQNQP